jgi:hypothetical protein
MQLVPLVRIARARIQCVAELEQEVAQLLEALGDEPHAKNSWAAGSRKVKRALLGGCSRLSNKGA